MTRERATSAYFATKDEHVPAPIVLVEQDGHWKITHDTAIPNCRSSGSKAADPRGYVGGI